MKALAQWMAIALLLVVYLAALWALSHPNVSEGYRAYYIEHLTSDWSPVRYPGSPAQGIDFKRPGLPEWVGLTIGFSTREDWGRWTDGNVAKIPELTLAQPVSGPVCLDFTLRPAASQVEKSFAVRMGSETKAVSYKTANFADYKVPFTLPQGVDRVEFLLPAKLPRQGEVEPTSSDMRRLGLAFVNLRITPGDCPVDPAQPSGP